MTGIIQRHRALQKFLLMYGRKTEVRSRDYYPLIGYDNDYVMCIKDGLLHIVASTNELSQAIIKVHITKRGMQYLKRNPYKHAREAGDD